MKFDVIVGNPPFSTDVNGPFKRKNLYPAFFKMATEHSDLVAMIMPWSNDAAEKTLKDHNKLIDQHLQEVEDCTDSFKVRGRQHYIIWDKNQKPKVTISKQYTYHLPRRERINFVRGNNKFGATETNWPGTYRDKPRGTVVPVMNKLNKNGIEYTWLKPNETEASLFDLPEKWFVVVPEKFHHKEGGWAYAEVVKNEGQQWTTNILVFPFNTRKEAEEMKDWLESSEFRSYCKELGAESLSKLRTLPSYK